MSETHYTIGQLCQRYDLPDWRIRRAVDAINSDVPRYGRYRIVPESLLPTLEAKLRELGCLKEQEVAQ